MYHMIVRRRIMKLFAAINAGDPAPVVRAFSDPAEHVMIGDHALGGRRVSRQAIAAWYDRMFRLLRDVRFDVVRIDISGPPWATVAIIEWHETNSATDGVQTSASGAHVVHLKWGRMTRLIILTDTAKLKATLARIADKGTTEAMALPITDAPPWP